MTPARCACAAILAGSLLLAACGSVVKSQAPPVVRATQQDAEAPTSGLEPPVDETPATALPDAPDPAGSLALSKAEVYPNAKRLAAAVAQAITTYDAPDALPEGLDGLLSAAAVADLLEDAADLRHPDSWSRGRAIYAQLGGATSDRVSVMVVTEQTVGSAEGERTETRTLDVRLRLDGAAWSFDRLASTGGSPPTTRRGPSAEARAVLEDPRIELPDSARWDILAGDVSPTLLRLMARAAERTPYSVVVLSAGHPDEIFGTDRPSDHIQGQAVDIYRISDVDVIDDRHEGSTTAALAEWFYAQDDVARIGGPWAMDGFGGRSFTDVVHQDHLHVAVAD